MPSIGQQLANAREVRKLSIEDVAFYTHIPAARVRDMENDDLSRFANLTYARGFLKIYSNFLALDLSDYLSQFSTAEFAEASGHEYIQMASATRNLPPAVITDYGRARYPGIYLLLLAALAAGAIIWWNHQESPPSAGPDKIAASKETAAPPPPPSVPEVPAGPGPLPASPLPPPDTSSVEKVATLPATPAAGSPAPVFPATLSSGVRPPKAVIIEEE